MGNSDTQGFRSMHGTSDFTVALASTVSRSLRRGYESAPRTFTRWARMGTLADFRPATRVAVAGNLSLEKVNEFGEFKRGRITDAGEQIQLATFGKVVGVSRQAVINDDLDFLSRLPAMFGRAAADFESDTVYGILTANANMADGVALFHANHGNLAGTGGAISETTLSAARLALRQQKDPSGNNQPLNLVGRYIIVPAARETAAQKMFAAVVTATKTDDTNVFQNAYEIVTEPRLDANSATAWYLAADSSQIDTIEYAYLEGEQGLYTEQRNGFDVDGLEVKARLDFAAKATDWRGLYRNPGA
jgi:phage major head subunit gpT-like protein